MLKRAMDRDMKAQIKNADNKFRNVGLSANGVALINNMFDLESDRAIAIQEMNLKALDQEISAKIAKAQAPSVVEALTSSRAEIRTQIAGLRRQLAQSLRGQQTTSTTFRRVGGQRAVTVKQLREQAREITGTEGFDRELFVRDLNGNAQTKQEGVAIRGELKTIANVRGMMNRIDALKAKGPTLLPTERRAADSLVQALSLELAVYKNLGAISETDKDFVEGMTSGGENPLTFANFQGGRIRELRGTLKRSVRNMENLVITVDFIPETFRERGPKGQTPGQVARGEAREF